VDYREMIEQLRARYEVVVARIEALEKSGVHHRDGEMPLSAPVHHNRRSLAAGHRHRSGSARVNLGTPSVSGQTTREGREPDIRNWVQGCEADCSGDQVPASRH
jgi:hypothetical protein